MRLFPRTIEGHYGKISGYCRVAGKGEDDKKILRKNYEVAASNGHVRDLPKSQMGIDVENDLNRNISRSAGKGISLPHCGKK